MNTIKVQTLKASTLSGLKIQKLRLERDKSLSVITGYEEPKNKFKLLNFNILTMVNILVVAVALASVASVSLAGTSFVPMSQSELDLYSSYQKTASNKDKECLENIKSLDMTAIDIINEKTFIDVKTSAKISYLDDIIINKNNFNFTQYSSFKASNMSFFSKEKSNPYYKMLAVKSSLESLSCDSGLYIFDRNLPNKVGGLESQKQPFTVSDFTDLALLDIAIKPLTNNDLDSLSTQKVNIATNKYFVNNHFGIEEVGGKTSFKFNNLGIEVGTNFIEYTVVDLINSIIETYIKPLKLTFTSKIDAEEFVIFNKYYLNSSLSQINKFFSGLFKLSKSAPTNLDNLSSAYLNSTDKENLKKITTKELEILYGAYYYFPEDPISVYNSVTRSSDNNTSLKNPNCIFESAVKDSIDNNSLDLVYSKTSDVYMVDTTSGLLTSVENTLCKEVTVRDIYMLLLKENISLNESKLQFIADKYNLKAEVDTYNNLSKPVPEVSVNDKSLPSPTSSIPVTQVATNNETILVPIKPIESNTPSPIKYLPRTGASNYVFPVVFFGVVFSSIMYIFATKKLSKIK